MPAIRSVRVRCVPVGLFDTNCYLIENEDTDEMFIVDPGDEAARIIEAVGQKKPVAVLLTHGHYDHCGAADEVCGHFDIPLYLHSEDIPLLTDSELNASAMIGPKAVVNTEAIPLREGQKLPLAGMEVTVWHTPGHTPGCCCFLLPDEQGVLCGDTLFDGGYGRTDLPGGDFEKLKQSLRRLFHMHPRVRAYPGHGAFTYAGADVPGENP